MDATATDDLSDRGQDFLECIRTVRTWDYNARVEFIEGMYSEFSDSPAILNLINSLRLFQLIQLTDCRA